MCIRLKYRVSFNALPAALTVTDFDGNVIYSENVSAVLGEIYFYSNSRNLIIRLSPLNQNLGSSVRYVKLPCQRRYCLAFNFDFTSSAPDLPLVFRLTDANYFFPIASAELNFSSAL